MFFLGVLLVQVLCAPLLSNGASLNASEQASTSGTATPTLSADSTVTIDAAFGVPSSSVVEPSSTTSTRSAATSAIGAGLNASEQASTSGTATPTLSADSTLTIDVAFDVPSSSVVEPSSTTSTRSGATSAIVQDLLNEANNNLQGIQNMGPISGSTGDNGVTAGNAPKGECDDLNWKPIMGCSINDRLCRGAYIRNVSKLFECKGSKPENVLSMELAGMIESVGEQGTKNLIEKVKLGEVAAVNASSFLVKDIFALSSGIIDGRFVNTTDDKYLNFPNYSMVADRFTGRWETVRDQISFPVKVLKKRVLAGAANIPYTWSVYPDLIEDRPLKMTEIETDYNQIIKDSDVSDLYLDNDGALKSRKKFEGIFINSNVFSLNIIMERFRDLEEPVLITLRHKKDSLKEPSCVYWDTTKSIWSRKGCKIQETNSTHTVCACNHLTMFGLAMKEEIVEDLSDREAVVTTATVFGIISTLLLIGSAICVFVVGYHFVDNMRIALNIELAFVLGHLFFFIGLSNNSSKYVATPATCDVISPFVHMFELAGLTFLLMEGIFYVERFSSVFNKKNTRTFYIYLALGWGLPVALAAACAGYPYSHYGAPIGNEFCWLSVNGVDVWFFGAPVLILVLLNLMVRGVVLQKVLGWKGNSDDINIQRTRIRLISSIVLLPVIILTWLFGILATNHSNKKVYHYFFIIFHFLQGLLVFIFYCARNTEMWEYYKDKKERKLAEKNAVYHFQYVP